MRMTRLVLLGLALLGGTAARAGEELMPMRGNAYSEVSSAAVGAIRKATSLDAPGDRRGQAVPQTQRNMVRVTLPSLGAKSEAPPRLIEMDSHNLDGSLNFSLVRPAPNLSDSGIPGLVMPEILAIDKYRLADPEPALPPMAFPEPEMPHAGAGDAAARERALARLAPLRDMPPPSRAPDFPPLPPARPIAGAVVQAPPFRAEESHSPLRVDLSPSPSRPDAPFPDVAEQAPLVFREADIDDFSAVAPLRPPSSLRPPAEKRGGRRPSAAEPPDVRVPVLALEEINVPGAGAMLPAGTPYFPMPDAASAPPFAESGASVETLREVLSPIYRAEKW